MPRRFSTLAPLFWQARFSTLYGNHRSFAPPLLSLSICSDFTPPRFFEPNHKPPLFLTCQPPQESHHLSPSLSPCPAFSPSYSLPPRTIYTPPPFCPTSQYFPKPTPQAKSLLRRIPNPIQKTILFLIIYPLLPIINLIYQFLLIFISKY